MNKLARMHTAEHLLSAVMRKNYEAPRNLEFHLNEKKTKCDYDVPRALIEEDMQTIERLVNKEISRNHEISYSFLQRHEASNYDLWLVPPDAPEVRIVTIGTFDAQPCVGQHVENTQQIGKFCLSSYEVRDNGRLRIRFKVE